MNACQRRTTLSGAVLLLVLAACGRAPGAAPTAPEVVVVSRAKLPATPGDPAWHAAPVHVAQMLLQDMVEPRLLEPSTASIRVRAMSDGARVAFLIQWADAARDDEPRPGSFPDACAVQLPARTQPDVPAPQMGEVGRPVEITLWRASWQADVEGREASILSLYERASVDHYPYDAASLEPGSDAQRAFAARYSPARALGNAAAGPREQPVEDLVAEGPGTLQPAAGSTSTARGEHGPTGWSVVVTRALPAELAPGQRTQVAFAVWQGSGGEVGARKMRTGWIPMMREGAR